jgi:REP element-mobilizing transposase RayT
MSEARCGAPQQPPRGRANVRVMIKSIVSRMRGSDGWVSAQFHTWRQLFFTVTLADRNSTTLVDRIDALRAAFRTARRERPFLVDAVVILPEHLHAILTLPPGDADFPGRWRRIKGHFSGQLIAAGTAAKRRSNGELGLWQRRFWEHTVRVCSKPDFARGLGGCWE